MSGKKQMLLTIALGAVLALIPGCDDMKKASNKNFKASLNRMFTKRPILWSRSMQEYPVYLDNTSMNAKEKKAEWDELCKAGLLKATDTLKRPTSRWVQSEDAIEEGKAIKYEITDYGKRFFMSDTANFLFEVVTDGFFMGYNEVDEIIEYTEPGDNFGAVTSQVKFRLKATKVAEWVNKIKESEVLKKDLDKLNDSSTKIAVMVLTSNGWKHIVETQR